MKKKALKKLFSTTCLVLAMCLALQSTALAAEVTWKDWAGFAASDEAEEPDTDDNNKPEENAEQDEDSEPDTSDTSAPSDTPEEPDSEPAEEPDDSSENPSDSSEEPDSSSDVPEKDPADIPSHDPADSSEGDTSAIPDGSMPDGPVVGDPLSPDPLAEGSNGWVKSTNANGTTVLSFYYWENTTTTKSIQAKDEVLYLPVDTKLEREAADGSTTVEYTFAKGCYYFDANGALVIGGNKASVGVLEVLKQDASTGKYLSDDSTDEDGKVVKVTTAQKTNGDGSVAVTSTVDYYSGKYAGDGLHYSKGVLYTGFYRTESGNLYYITDGEPARYTGKYKTENEDRYGDTVYKGDDLYYYNGKIYSGYWWYNKKIYVIDNGKGGTLLTGVMSTKKYYVNSNLKRGKGNGKLYSKGKVYTGGYSDGYFYQKGVKKTDYKGWKTFDTSGNSSSDSSDNTYYFQSNGKYVTGWKTLSRNGNKYKYYFNDNGTLCKNIYKKFTAYKKKPTKIVVSRGTHTATMYAKNGDSYNIPCKSFVVSTSKKSENTKFGTYSLTSRQAWFKIDGVRWWYKWATYISGSGSWFHSEQYYEKGNHKSLNNNSYNGLGTNQSKMCVRMQVVNCKLIYDMRGGGYIKQVVLNNSSNKGPFGKMTLSDNVDHEGKLPKDKRGYEPTDPKAK